MTAVALIPIFLSALLLAAHFFRAGRYELVAASLLFPFLLLIRRRWAARAVQVVLVLGAAEWVRTLFVFTAERRALGEPSLRLVAILGGVALFTLLSASALFLPRLRRRYAPPAETP